MRLTFTLAAIMPVAFSFADTIQVVAGRDNTLVEDMMGRLSNGSGGAIHVGRTGQINDSRRRGLIWFDLASVPLGATVTSVELSMHLSRVRSDPATVFVHRATADWGEGESVAPVEGGASNGGGRGVDAEPGDATWVHTFFDDRFWSVPGGDFVAEPSASRSVGDIGFYTWDATAALVADVQGWVDDPSSNFGWVLVGDESRTETSKRFDSRESESEANRPRLVVEFVPPEGEVRACCTPLGDCLDVPVDVCGMLLEGTAASESVSCVDWHGCCEVDGDCDDDDEFTSDSCVSGQCVHVQLPVPCDDGNPCTENDVEVGGACAGELVEGCCISDDACDDGDPCTIDVCDSLVCVFMDIEGCCVDDADCDDSNACTKDACVEGACTNIPEEGCCVVDEDCATDEPCAASRCEGNVCTVEVIEGCCVEAVDCDDEDACTEDACVDNECVNDPVLSCGPGGPDSDGGGSEATGFCGFGAMGCILVSLGFTAGWQSTNRHRAARRGT